MHGPNLRSVNFGWTGLVVDTLQHFQHGFVDLTSPCLHGAQASDMTLQATAQYLSRASHTMGHSDFGLAADLPVDRFYRNRDVRPPQVFPQQHPASTKVAEAKH